MDLALAASIAYADHPAAARALDRLRARTPADECPDCGATGTPAGAVAQTHPLWGDYDLDRFECPDCGGVWSE